MSMRYVAGFVFNPGRTHSLLIRKTKPSWQAGLWNAIGGKVENGESMWDAMVRECREECGLDIPRASWEFIANITNVDASDVRFFSAVTPQFEAYRTTTDEPVRAFHIEAIQAGRLGTYGATVGNIPLLLAAALDNGHTVRPLILQDTGKARQRVGAAA